VTHLQLFFFFLCKARSKQQLCYREPTQRKSDRVAKDWDEEEFLGEESIMFWCWWWQVTRRVASQDPQVSLEEIIESVTGEQLNF
jgi:hypothetical protein